MVQLRTDCFCGVCDGSGGPPDCFGNIIGGWACLCRCHHDEDYKAQRIKEREETIRQAIALWREVFELIADRNAVPVKED